MVCASENFIVKYIHTEWLENYTLFTQCALIPDFVQEVKRLAENRL